LKILVACEESQTVTKELRALGHEAFSCDLEPCSGGHPEWHLQCDALKEAYSGKYEMMIAHPPCTYLSHAGARWLYPKGVLNKDRLAKGMEAKELFVKLLEAPIEKIAIENPTPSKVYGLPPHSQVVQPYEFGDEAQKKTLLWTKGLPYLVPTDIVGKGDMVTYKSGKTKAKWFMDAAKAKTPKERAKLRSKTFPGIAKAMALQWAGLAL
jgi:hypothetical protein